MNNEEKILSILETMNDRMGAMNNRLDKLEVGQQNIRKDISKLEVGQQNIRKDIADMKLELKEGVWKDIDRLYKRVDKIENHVGIR